MRCLLVLFVVLLGAGSAGCSAPYQQGPQIGWENFVKLGGITYTAEYSVGAGSLTEDDLGVQYGSVIYRAAGNVKEPASSPLDGHAAYLEPGTPIFMLRGYSPLFRIAALKNRQIVLYEAETNPQAKIGADLLDLIGKVTHITLGSSVDGQRLSQIADPDLIQKLVAHVDRAPVFSPGAGGARSSCSDERYMLTFHLRDGTTSTRGYCSESGYLGAGAGLRMPPEFGEAIKDALSNGRG